MLVHMEATNNTNRITAMDLENARKAHETCLRRYGMLAPSDKLGLQIGSKLYGNAYRLYVLKPGESGHYEAPVLSSSGYLGMTAREAWETLTMATGVIYRTQDMTDRYERQSAD